MDNEIELLLQFFKIQSQCVRIIFGVKRGQIKCKFCVYRFGHFDGTYLWNDCRRCLLLLLLLALHDGGQYQIEIFDYISDLLAEKNARTIVSIITIISAFFDKTHHQKLGINDTLHDYTYRYSTNAQAVDTTIVS